VQLVNSIRGEFDFKKNQFELSLKDYLSNTKNSLAVLVTADYLDLEENLEFWQVIYKKYSDEFGSNSYFKNFEDKLIKIKSISVGSIAPDIILNDTSGVPISLASLRGKYVLLDFWAAWCRPCREENPNIVQNYNKYKSKGFEVYQVSLDRNKNDWVRGIIQDKLPWVNVSDLKYYQSEAAEIYDVDRIPSAFLLDPDGKIIAKNTDLRGSNLTKKLQEIFN
jgi:peroxiredoxin